MSKNYVIIIICILIFVLNLFLTNILLTEVFGGNRVDSLPPARRLVLGSAIDIAGYQYDSTLVNIPGYFFRD